MPEADKEGERYFADQPQAAPGFFLKGSHQLDWGMKNRLARTFNPVSGRTVMLAVDHGYFQGPTTGLERIDLSIVPLLPQCDALFCTRGILRSVIPAESTKPMVLRASGGPSILKELSDEQIAMDMEDALRLNASGVGIQVFIGGEHETRSIHNMTKLVEAEYEKRQGKKRRVTGVQLGYEARCALPHAFDVILGSQLGVGAYRALAENHADGVLVSVSGQLNLNYVPFDTLIDPETLVTVVRFIQPGSDFQRLARSLESYPHD